MPVTAWLLLVTVLFAVARFLIPGDANPHVIHGFAAAAHLYVGGLFAVFLVKRRYPFTGASYPALLMAVALTIVEVVAFFSKR